MLSLCFIQCLLAGRPKRSSYELTAAGEVTKCRPQNGQLRGGKPWTKGAIYKVLANRVYRGEAVHKGVAYPG